MSSPVPFVSHGAEIYSLPEYVRTRNGVTFDPRADRWAFRDSAKTVSLDFSRVLASPVMVTSLKATLVWYAENKSPHHLANMFERFSHFLRTLSSDGGIVGLVSANDLLNYRSSLSTDQRWYLGNLSGFLQKWHSMGHSCVTDDAIAFLKQLRLKGNRKGEAVLTMDTENGPCTDIEFESIYAALDASYEAEKIDLSEYLLVWLFMALGQRPIQYAGLKLCDFVVGMGRDGATVYTLRIPRAKQRGQLSRGDFKDRVLIPQIGEQLVQLRDRVRDVDAR